MQNINRSDLFDPELLKKWQEVDAQNWKGIIKDIVEVFFASTPDEYSKLLQAVATKDRKKLELYSHSLKSSHGNVGAKKLQYAFAAIEKMSMTAPWDKVQTEMVMIEDLKNNTYPLLKSYMGTL